MSDYYDLPPDSTFLVSAKGVIVNDKNEVLMLKTPKNNFPWSEKWGFPGGLVDFNESLTDALAREVKEELNATVDIGESFAVGTYFVSVPFTFKDGRVMTVRIIGVAYKCHLRNSNAPITLSDEHSAYEWIPMSKVASLNLSRDSGYIVEKLPFAS